MEFLRRQCEHQNKRIESLNGRLTEKKALKELDNINDIKSRQLPDDVEGKSESTSGKSVITLLKKGLNVIVCPANRKGMI